MDRDFHKQMPQSPGTNDANLALTSAPKERSKDGLYDVVGVDPPAEAMTNAIFRQMPNPVCVAPM
jgi:hypothetical protein